MIKILKAVEKFYWSNGCMVLSGVYGPLVRTGVYAVIVRMGVYSLIVRTVRTLLSYVWGVYGLSYAQCVRSLSERYRTHGAYVKDFQQNVPACEHS